MFKAIPDPCLAAIAEGVNFAELTHLREGSQMTDEEWENAMLAIEKTQAGASTEDNRGSQLTLARQQQFTRHVLDPHPVVVTRANFARDLTLMYNAGVAMGNGTPEQRVEALDFIDRFELFDDDSRAAQLRLSSPNSYIHHGDVGHDYPIRTPEAIVEEVGWVMDNLARTSHS